VVRHRTESLLVVLGSVLGTALIVASFVVGDSLDRSVRQSAYEVLGPVDGDDRHTQTSFGLVVMGAHAVTLGVELRRPGEVLRAADRTDPDGITSVPRRARHLIEVARAHRQRRQDVAALALLDKAERTAPETIRYNDHGRRIVFELMDKPPTGFRSEVRDLAGRLKLLPG
jgi:hypothetical protein